MKFFAPLHGSALLAAGALILSAPLSQAADPVFSGPQPGEKITPFKVLAITGSASGTERNPVEENKTAPLTLVFLHTVERSLVPLLRAVDEYGAMRKDSLKTEVVFLSGDRISGEERMKAVSSSLKLKSNLGLSLDGAEGPGNYGLNKECMMTIIVTKDNEVTANFALVQPGIADAPKVVEAMAKISGDDKPPSVEQLVQRGPAGMRRGEGRMAQRPQANDNFPGAAPTDEKLAGMLRQFIRPTNDKETVDRTLKEVNEYITKNPALKKQAINGWTRVLHFGDRYGNEYSRKAGQEALEKWKQEE